MDKETKDTSDIRGYTDDKGKFKEGNPGKPKGAKNKFSITMLEEAIEAEEKSIEKQKGAGLSIGVFQQFIRMAYREPSVMIALMKKFVPDKSSQELSGIDEITFNIKHLDNGNKPPD